MMNAETAPGLILCLLLLATLTLAEPYAYYFSRNDPIVYTRPDTSAVEYSISFRLQIDETGQNEGVILYTRTESGEITVIEVEKEFLYVRHKSARRRRRFLTRTIEAKAAATATESSESSSGSGLKLWETDFFNVSMGLKFNATRRYFDVNKVSSYSSSSYTEFGPIGKTVYIGGYPQDADKSIIKSRRSLKACLTDFTINDVNVFKKAHDDELGPISQPTTCQMKTNHVFLSGVNSYILLQAEDVSGGLQHLAMDFRSFDYQATLLHIETDNGNITVSFRKNTFSIAFSNGTTLEDTTDTAVDDGNYYTLKMITLLPNYLNLAIVREENRFTRPKLARTLEVGENRVIQRIYIGGMPGEIGLQACLKQLKTQTRFEVRDIPSEQLQNVELGNCVLINKCGNLCSHGAPCLRDLDGVSCDCNNTGYSGPSCHTPMYPDRCDNINFEQQTEVETTIDTDGPGPLPPVPVKCVKDISTGEVKTVIQTPIGESVFRIDKFQDPGSYHKEVTYNTGINPAIDIIDRALTCKQNVSYECSKSRLMVTPEGSDFPYSWWIGRNNRRHFYWGSAAPDSRQCSCATAEGGCEGGLGCNCDAGTVSRDEGYITNRTHLPITEVRFGDTGTDTDDKSATFQIGNIECTGDYYKENTATIQSIMSKIQVRAKPGRYQVPMDVSFQFKTTIRKAQLFYIPGGDISILMQGPNSIQVEAASHYVTVKHDQEVAATLNDDNWHYIYFELTKSRAFLTVDRENFEIWRPEKPIWMDVSLGYKAYIGGNSMGTFGFAGCVRDLRYQGQRYDLVEIVNNDKDVNTVPGCTGKCSTDDMCNNGGTCTEYYTTYMCDCSSSAFSGCYCGQAIGVSFPSGSWMKFMIGERLGSTHNLAALQLDFKTTQRSGTLAHVTGTGNTALLTVLINAGGFVEVRFSDRKSLVSSNALTDASHRVSVHLTSTDATTNTWEVQFDDENKTETSEVPSGSPVEFYLASDSSSPSQTGFNGCIFGVLYNGVPLLKEAKSETTPAYISLSDKVTVTNNCGDSQPNQTEDSDSDVTPAQSNYKRPVYLTSFGPSSLDPRTGHTPATILYQVNSLVCDTLHDNSTSYTITQNGGDLFCPHLKVHNTVLLPPDQRVTGQYQCKTSNQWTTAVSGFQEVVLASPPVVSITEQEDVALKQFEYGRVRCDVSTASVPDPGTRWEGVDLTDPRFYQSVDGNLHFVYVESSDVKSYSCYKFNSLIQNEVLVKQINLQLSDPIQTGPRPSPDIKLVYATSSPVAADLGSEVVLECLADGPSPLPEITWERSDESASRFPVKGRRLVISEFSEMDVGNYSCKAENTTLAEIEVQFSMKPRWLQGPTEIRVYSKDNAMLYCKTHPNNTTLTREWFINGESLQVSDRYKLNDDGDCLTITNATKESDILAFQCKVSNEYGYLFGHGTLHVLSPTTITTRPESVATVTKSRTSVFLTAECDTDIDSRVTFTWYRGDTKVKDSRVYTVYSSSTRSTLHIRFSRGDWYENLTKYKGIYKCVIDDGVKEQTVFSEVKIGRTNNVEDNSGKKPGSGGKGLNCSSGWIALWLAMSMFGLRQL